MDALDRKILTMLADGPRWARSFQHVKPYVRGLIDQGLVERVKPAGGRGANMLALMAAGGESLSAAPTLPTGAQR